MSIRRSLAIADVARARGLCQVGEMTSEATVFVVDDNLGMRRSLRALMESAGLAVETYASGEEFLEAYDLERPGCLLLDIRLQRAKRPRPAGRAPAAEVDAADHHLDRPRNGPGIGACAESGSRRLPAEAGSPEAASRAGARRHRERQSGLAPRPPSARPWPSRLDQLTRREREVTELLITGKTSKEIAAMLRASPRTVEGHRRMVFLKMGVSSASQLVRLVLSAR
jgi:FixJ family two-component response regulator